MTNYVKRLPEKVLAACRKLFSEKAAKTVTYSDRTACQRWSCWQWNVDGDRKLGKQTYSMWSQVLFHVTPCRLTATSVSKNHRDFIFRIKQIYKIHLRWRQCVPSKGRSLLTIRHDVTSHILETYSFGSQTRVTSNKHVVHWTSKFYSIIDERKTNLMSLAIICPQLLKFEI